MSNLLVVRGSGLPAATQLSLNIKYKDLKLRYEYWRESYWESETLNGVNDIVEGSLPTISPSYPTIVNKSFYSCSKLCLICVCMFFLSLTSQSLPIHSLCSPLETECWSLHTRTKIKMSNGYCHHFASADLRGVLVKQRGKIIAYSQNFFLS